MMSCSKNVFLKKLGCRKINDGVIDVVNLEIVFFLHHDSRELVLLISPRLHEQIKPLLIAQILAPYEVTPEEFAQVNAA